jgi:hypothetical protein
MFFRGDVLDQSNITSIGTYAVWYENGDTEKVSQSFTAGINGPLSKVSLQLKKLGNPPNLIMELRTVSGDDPLTILTSVEKDMNEIGTTVSEITFNFSTPYTVVSGTKYAFVIYLKTSGDTNNKIYLAYNVPSQKVYLNGKLRESMDNEVTWVPVANENADAWFKTYIHL